MTKPGTSMLAKEGYECDAVNVSKSSPYLFISIQVASK